jgi:hypothetical protein
MLKAKLTADEFKALPAVLQEHYKQEGDSHVLDADVVGDVSKLSKALESERGASGTLKQEIAKLKDQFKDLDPEKAREAMKRIQEIQDKELLDAGKVDELFKQKTERMLADHAAQLKAKDDIVTKVTGERDAYQGSLKKLRIDGQIREIAAKKGVKPEAIADAVARFTLLGVDGTLWDMDGDAIVAKKNGQIRYGKTAEQPMTFEEGFELLVKEAPHLFGESSGSGAHNTNGNGARNVGNQFVISQDQARDPLAYRAAREQADKAGRTLSIAAS